MSLPKKGDRVLILECGKGATLMRVGQICVLHTNAEHSSTPGKVTFRYVRDSGRIRSSGAVAVQVLTPAESPAIQSASEGLAKLEEERVTVTRQYLIDVHRDARKAGLRRAQELAKEHVNFDDSSHVPGRLGEGRLNWTDFDAAVERELRK